MIFKPEMVQRILAGSKTMTRRKLKPGETECRYREGRPYAVQAGRGKKATTRIVVTEVRAERLGDISDADAQREGFRGRHQFNDYWRKLHGSLEPDEQVWVISFHLLRELPVRLLARDSSHGYTDKRSTALGPDNTQHREVVEDKVRGLRRVVIEDEPEAVDEITLEQFAHEAASTGEVLRAEQKLKERGRSVGRRVREEAIQSGRAGVDVTEELAAIQELVERMERKRERAA